MRGTPNPFPPYSPSVKQPLNRPGMPGPESYGFPDALNEREALTPTRTESCVALVRFVKMRPCHGPLTAHHRSRGSAWRVSLSELGSVAASRFQRLNDVPKFRLKSSITAPNLSGP